MNSLKESVTLVTGGAASITAHTCSASEATQCKQGDGQALS